MLQSPSRRDLSVAKSLRPFVSSDWVECKSGANIKALAFCLARSPPGRAPTATIVFIALPTAQCKPGTDCAEAAAETIIRRRPVCACDSIVGHGRRRKQAHDEYHDWIGIRLGFCNICGKTITFLPMFSLPYTHYSLIARSEALRPLLCRWLFLRSSRAARQRSQTRSGPIHAPPLVSGSGFLSAAFFVLTTNDPEGRSLDG